MKIQRQIIYITLLSLGITTAFLWFSYTNHKQTISTQNWVNHTNETIKALNNIESYVTNVESGTRGYVISDSSIFIHDIPKTTTNINNTLTLVKSLTADNYEQEKRILILERIINEKLTLQNQIAELKKNRLGGADKIVSSLRGKITMDSIYLVLNQMKETENGLLQQRMSDNENSVQTGLTAVFVAAAIYFPTILFFLWVLNNNTIRRTRAEQKVRASEKQLKVLMRSVREGFFMLDNDLCIVVTNFDNNKDFFRLDDSALKGKQFITFFPERCRLSVVEELNEALHGSSGKFEISHDEKNELLWMQISYSPVYNHHGRITGVAILTEDITEKKRTEARLKDSELKLKSIVNSTQDGFYLVDDDYNLLMMNEAGKNIMLTIYGTSLLKGESLLKFSPPDRKKIVEERLAKVMSGSPEYIEFKIPTANGEKWYETLYYPVINEEQKVTGICISSRDITDRMYQQQQLVAAKKAAESAERLQETFLANMSHEIRTPMNGIVGMTNILMDTSLTEEQKEFVQIIKQSSDTLLFLINDILDLSKIKAGKLNIEKVPFSLDDVLDSVLAPFILKAKDKGIDLQITNKPNVPLQILGDRYRLVQILNNLLSNALKFTNRGHVWLSVKELVVGSDAILEFSVSDTGIGIPEEKIATVFNSFEQGTDGTTRKYGGTGLGLAITKNLVELQGGEIGVTSFENKGTTFVFILKYKVLNNVPVVIPSSINIETLSRDLKGKHVLVAEDNEVNQRVVTYNLEHAGLKVTIANNGKEAVELLEKGNKYDLVIMDLQMPEMTGFQATVYIRNKLRMNIPIIAMTASVMRNERVKCMAVGMNDYISKPFDTGTLLIQMNRLLGIEVNGAYIQPEPALSNELYDLAYLREMDDQDYVVEVLGLFLQTVPSLLNKINVGILHNQPLDIYSAAHKLKTSLGLLRIHKMLHFNTEIESRTKDQTTIDDKRLAEISAAYKALLEQFHLIKPLIEAELNEARSVQI